jgi:AmiR/NasT family two-component response regulator
MNSRHVLIVEDELILAMDMEARLVDLGYAVVGIASTGAAAVAAAEQHQPDLILMGIRLSGDMGLPPPWSFAAPTTFLCSS